jgi:hypothetical protein
VLFTIAEDLSKMELYVDIDEADVGQVKKGHVATFVLGAPKEVQNSLVAYSEEQHRRDAVMQSANAPNRLFPLRETSTRPDWSASQRCWTPSVRCFPSKTSWPQAKGKGR